MTAHPAGSGEDAARAAAHLTPAQRELLEQYRAAAGSRSERITQLLLERDAIAAERDLAQLELARARQRIERLETRLQRLTRLPRPRLIARRLAARMPPPARRVAKSAALRVRAACRRGTGR